MKDVHFWIFNIHAGGKSWKAREEEHGDQAQLTRYKRLTQETDILQHPLVSVTDSDGQQLASRNARLSDNSVDSGVGISFSPLSHRKFSHKEDIGELASPATQFLPAHERGNTTTHVLLSIKDASLSPLCIRSSCACSSASQMPDYFLVMQMDEC